MKISTYPPLRWPLALLSVGVLCAVSACGSLAPPPAPSMHDDNPSTEIDLQAESGANGNPVMSRTQASGGQTVLLKTDGSVVLPFDLRTPGLYKLAVRYSTDGPGVRSEQVDVAVDGHPAGQFEAQNTRTTQQDPGGGWDSFVTSPAFGPINLSRDSHTVTVKVSAGDRYGIEIDEVTLTRNQG
jgi:cytoskeletal protein RodZ